MLKYISFFLLISSFGTLIKSNHILDDLHRNDDMVEYAKVALHMVQRYISPKTNTLIIMEKCDIMCKAHDRYHKTLLHHFLHHLNDSLAIQLFFGQPEDRPWDYNLFVVDSWWAFEALRFQIPITKHERDYYFFVLLTYSPNHLKYRNLRKIFELCLRFSVKNVIVMNKSTNDDFMGFYTYELFTTNKCHEDFEIREINRFENGKLQNSVFFPKKLTNFNGCALGVSAHVIEPLITFMGDPENSTHLLNMTLFGGIEGDILKLLAETLNFKIRLQFPRQSNKIKIYLNSTGSFGHLESHKAQIAIGGLNSTVKNSFKFTSTIAYHTTPYVFVVRGGVFFGPIKQLLYPLYTTTWIFLSIHLILSMIFIQIIEHYRAPYVRNFIFGSKNKNPMRNMLTIYLGNPLPAQILPKRNFARFMLMTWLLLSFEIRNGYQGKMFDSLRVSRRIPVPKKISELIDLDYTLLTSKDTDFYPTNKSYIMHNATARLDMLQMTERRLTTMALLDYVAHYNFKRYNTSTLTYVQEKIYSHQYVMYLNKHSLLRESFDHKLKLFASSGLTSRFANQHVHPFFLNMNSRPESVSQITHRNLQGLYYLYAIMCEISIFTFIFELLTRKSKRLKRIMDWLN